MDKKRDSGVLLRCFAGVEWEAVKQMPAGRKMGAEQMQAEWEEGFQTEVETQVEVDQTGQLEMSEEAVRKQAVMWEDIEEEDIVGLGPLAAGERQYGEIAVVAGGQHWEAADLRSEGGVFVEDIGREHYSLRG